MIKISRMIKLKLKMKNNIKIKNIDPSSIVTVYDYKEIVKILKREGM